MSELVRTQHRHVAQVADHQKIRNRPRFCLLIKDAPGLERVEILRYHKTAGAKYAMIGRTYAPGFDTGAEPRVHDVFSDYNLKTLIQ